MDKILRFLLKHCSFLYKEYGYKFTDSRVSDSFGGDAFLALSSDSLKVRFCLDRGQLFFDFQSKHKNGSNSWYSIDIVRQLVTKEESYFSLMDKENAIFLKRNIDKIHELFSNQQIKETTKELNKLKRIRSKKLFG